MNDAQEPQPNRRPAPQYGEYSDAVAKSSQGADGRSLGADDRESPEQGEPTGLGRNNGRVDVNGRAGQVGQYGENVQPGQSRQPLQNAQPVKNGHASQNGLQGVPHNLGVRGASNTRPTTSSATSSVTPASPSAPSSPAASSSAAAPSEPTSAPASDAPRSEQYGEYKQYGEPSEPNQHGEPSQHGQPNQQSQPNQHSQPSEPSQHGQPYRATEIPGHPPANLNAAGAQAVVADGVKPKRTADRFITIALLVLGAYGAMNMGFALMQLGAEVSRLAKILGIEDFTTPSVVPVLGNIGAIITLAIYALVLIFSIRRIRARKLTFWAPLAAGALALLIYFVLAIIAYMQSPELMEAMMQPEALQTVMNSLEASAS